MSSRARPWGVWAGVVGAACGYAFVAGHPLPGGAKAVEVPMFRNSTSETGTEAQFTVALRDELSLQGLLATGTSDARIEGEVFDVRSGPSVAYAVDAGFALGSFRLDAAVRVKLVRGAQVLAATEVRGSEDYARGPEGDILMSEGNRRAAVRRLAVAMMRDALHKLRTDF
jgi:hypothetical protein